MSSDGNQYPRSPVKICESADLSTRMSEYAIANGVQHIIGSQVGNFRDGSISWMVY